MKKQNITGQKDTQKKKKKRKIEKRKMADVHCKGEKNPRVSKCTKNIVELV